MLIAGNWKMNTIASEAGNLTDLILHGLTEDAGKVGVLVCPPFINIPAVAKIINNSSVELGAQNCSPFLSGAFTGEISIPMLKHYGCKYVIVGHSERRQFYFETNETINRKILALLNEGVKPVFCIGETLEQRQSGKTFDVLNEQIREGLRNTSEAMIDNIIIAYEPVWAIGTGVSAEVWQVQEVHEYIRNLLNELFGDIANKLIIQYGGSVNEKNAHSILELKDVNGALVGGASLKAESFLSIISSAVEVI